LRSSFLNCGLFISQEVKHGYVDLIQLDFTFDQAELGNGDIICFQVDPTPEEYVYHNLLLMYVYTNSIKDWR
jgi:hypothetical protein